MIVIVEIYGKQYKVAKGDTITVNSKIDLDIGKTVKFEAVKAIFDTDKNIFSPKELNKYKVSAKIIEHSRDKKITVIKKKRRKGYQRKNGHRQDLTMIEIQSITGSAKKTAKAKTDKE